jgi:hypothetical protein
MEVSCKNLLRRRTIFECEEGLDQMCLKIESEKAGMRGHEVKNHGKNDTYFEFNLYFEGRNFCGTMFNGGNREKFRRKNKTVKVKRIVVPRELRIEHPLEVRHVEGLSWGNNTFRLAKSTTLNAYEELWRIAPRERKRRFQQLNIFFEVLGLYDRV